MGENRMKRERKDESPARGRARMPKQKRGKLTRDKIIAAGERLFGERGFHGTDAKAIAKAAGVSTGSFYAYFNNKHELFVEVIKRNIERANSSMEMLLRSLQGRKMKGEGVLRKIIAETRKAHSISPDLHKEIMRMVYADAEVWDMVYTNEKRNIRILTDILKDRRNELRVRDIEAAAFVLYSAVEDMMHRLLVGHGQIEEEKILKELARMCHRYVFEETRKPRRGRK